MRKMAFSAFDNSYQDKRVLVTGHTGFKGAWLTIWLKMLGAQVIGFSLPPDEAQAPLFEGARVADGMVSLHGDIRDLETVTGVFAQHTPDIVFHLAAQSLVGGSYRDPVETATTNIMGTVNVLEAVRATPSVRAAVIITTDNCYENREWVCSYRENDPLGGYEPYSSSNAADHGLVEGAIGDSE